MESVLTNSAFCLIADGSMGAAVAQEVNGQYSFLCAIIAGVVTLAMLLDYHRHKNSGRIVIAAVAMTLTHPIWTVSAIGGDLGHMQRDVSIICTAIIVTLFFVMYYRQAIRHGDQKHAHSDAGSNPNAV